MIPLKRNAIILGLVCLAVVLHFHYCTWETGPIEKRRAVFGLNRSPYEMVHDLLGGEDGGIANPKERPPGVPMAHASVPVDPLFYFRRDYACGIAARQGDVMMATILGVLLPLGLLFVALDVWIARPRVQPALKAVTYRLASGHWATVYEKAELRSPPV